jgi:uncharacterized protein (DUF2384 family)
MGASSPSTRETRQPHALAESEENVDTESEIEELATNLMGNRESAQRWLRTPNRYLGGKSPRDVLDTDEGRHLVEESLYTIGYGGVG